ncbi:MAG: GlcNAc-transferase family protein [Ilumatobacter sp.]
MDAAHHESEAMQAAGWRLVTQSTVNGFAWDVHRVRFLQGSSEVPGELSGSGTAGDGFGVEHVGHDGPEFWGGRPDERNRFHVSIAAQGMPLCIDSVVIEQGSEHWAPSLYLECLDGNGEWKTVRRFEGLEAGASQLFLDPERTPPVIRLRSPRRVSASVAAGSGVRPFAFGRFDDRRVLVMIAAYRDSELPRTIEHALTQAAYPEHVRFAICHQYGDDTAELLDPWEDDPRFTIDAVPYTESRGCCWARNRTFAMFDDEPYVLQIDAHTRFAARWDSRYIDMLESVNSELPLLTTYPARYTLDHHGEVTYDLGAGTQRLYVEEVRPDLTTLQKTRPLVDLSQPAPSPTLAAGQIFTRGQFCRDVDYDPDIYFAGEEISLAARAYTSGYDLYCPNETLIWHRYDHDEPKHWEDHETHSASHATAMARLRTLFQGHPGSLGRHGLGSKRSLTQFERHAGVDLSGRAMAAPIGADGVLTIEIDRSIIEPRDDYTMFVVVLFDGDGNEVQRHDVRAPNVLDLTSATVRLRHVSSDAARSAVLTVTRGGSIGPLAIRPLRGVSG